MIRKAIVSGKFYSEFPDDLRSQIEACYLHSEGPGIIPGPVAATAQSNMGLIVPHAGYMYSGPVAAWAYKALADAGRPKTIILLCPNHTGYGMPLSVWPEGYWETPLGRVRVDEEVADMLVSYSDGIIESDTGAHTFEHAIEVQLPFLQEILTEDFSIVPLSMSDQRQEAVQTVASTISRIMGLGNPLTIIASSDLNHYAPQEITVEKDKLLIAALKKGDVHELYGVVKENKISACGIGPMSVVLSIFKEFRVLKHATSGDISGDLIHTVGYMSAILA